MCLACEQAGDEKGHLAIMDEKGYQGVNGLHQNSVNKKT